ncbi:MAG: methyltransferase [Thalassolituus sp.]
MPTWPVTGLRLECFPPVPDHISLAWDAADEYLLQESNSDIPSLILNERYGALSCALNNAASWTDSFCARLAAKQNADRNERTPARQLSWTELQNGDHSSEFEQILIRIPKQNDQLAAQLALIAAHYPHATVTLSGMAKHIPVSVLKWLEQHADNYQQLPIQRKARVLKVQGLNGFIDQQPKPKGFRLNGMSFSADAGVFCADKADPGAQVMIEHLPADLEGTICDLGCGNGILSAHLAKTNPQARIIATDDSELATIAATYNLEANGLNGSVRHGNILSAVDEPLDWIVCNPPFHDGHKQLTNIALSMFNEARNRLNSNGTLQVVANRHLPYQKPLQRLFRSVKVVSKHPKFNVFECRP